MIFAYADPPYFGMGKRLYGYPEWDEKERHHLLLRSLVVGYPDGWALSCNPRDLGWLLPECPEDVRVAAWCKTMHQIRPTGIQYAWEPVIWRGGHAEKGRNPMVRDWMASTARQHTPLIGAKPEVFCQWVLAFLGYQDGDEIHDFFPGTGIMERVAAQGTLL